MKIGNTLILAGMSAMLSAGAAAAPATPDTPSVDRGRYIAQISGCNDCHTPNYAATGGKVAQQDWLTGDRIGWRGPWGTTYPANLRQVIAAISEDDWVRNARSREYRPPMPWFGLRDMAESDVRSLYRFIRSLGPGGESAPAYVPPGQEPAGLAIVFPMPPQ